MNMSFPSKDMWLLSSWTPSIWGIFSPPVWSIPPPIEMIKLWCDLSLPLWHQFPRRVLLDICYKWVWSLSHKAKQQVECDAGRGQESLSGAGSKECRDKWQAVFPVVKSVAPSCVLWLHRKNSVGPKKTNRRDRVHHSETTCHLSSLDNLDLTRICKELDAWNAEQKNESRWSFFLKGETNMHETNARAHKRTRENFI